MPPVKFIDIPSSTETINPSNSGSKEKWMDSVVIQSFELKWCSGILTNLRPSGIKENHPPV